MVNKNLRIAVINGGSSAESEVSRSSAAGVIEALGTHYQNVQSVEMDQNLVASLANFGPDVVFPVLHGPPGEDGTMQGFLEMCGYAYVGSDVHGSAVAMDKVVAKGLFQIAGLPLAQQVVINLDDGIADGVARVRQQLGTSVVVKPARQGSAIGVTLVDNDNQLHDAIAQAFEFDSQLLVEERVIGKEITVGIIETDNGCEAFEVIEITTPEDAWYDYEHRYTQGLSEHIMPARLPDSQRRELQQIAVAAHQALGCRDLSRADFVVADDRIVLLEVNTLPGMTPTSLYPDGARQFGLTFPMLVSHLVERAALRSERT